MNKSLNDQALQTLLSRIEELELKVDGIQTEREREVQIVETGVSNGWNYKLYSDDTYEATIYKSLGSVAMTSSSNGWSISALKSYPTRPDPPNIVSIGTVAFANANGTTDVVNSSLYCTVGHSSRWNYYLGRGTSQTSTGVIVKHTFTADVVINEV